MPRSSSRPPDVRAVTSRWPARGAPSTTTFSPRSSQSAPSFSAVVVTSRQLSPEPASVAASATSAVPPTIFPSRAAAVSPPARWSSPPATTTVSTNGSTTSACPSASAITIVSTAPPPVPPASSGSVAPRMPSSSAKPRQMSGCQPGPNFAAARLFSRSYRVDRNLVNPSRSSSCSSVSEKSIYSPNAAFARMLR